MPLDTETVQTDAAYIRALVDNIETVIVGKRAQVELTVICLIAGGHILIEDVPGVGKTTLVSTLARSIDCRFKRIQFTPDLMPSDVTGFSIFNQKTGDFEFKPGSIMSNIVLADEINRASAKTQASLLEAMEERQVTVDGKTYRLVEPFMVLATQNPIESFGTYPLPEAQLDRFLMRISVGYPSYHEEIQVVANGDAPKLAVGPVMNGPAVIKLRNDAKEVVVNESVIGYAVQIVTATRSHPEILLGSSPRGSVWLTAAARAYALYQGRDYVKPDDVKYLAPWVLGHRVQLTHEARVAGRTAQQVLESVIAGIAVPVS